MDYDFKVINTFMPSRKLSRSPHSPGFLLFGFFRLTNNSVFLIWCHENLVTANTMFSKADLASEGGKLSRASSALFPW